MAIVIAYIIRCMSKGLNLFFQIMFLLAASFATNIMYSIACAYTIDFFLLLKGLDLSLNYIHSIHILFNFAFTCSICKYAVVKYYQKIKVYFKANLLHFSLMHIQIPSLIKFLLKYYSVHEGVYPDENIIYTPLSLALRYKAGVKIIDILLDEGAEFVDTHMFIALYLGNKVETIGHILPLVNNINFMFNGASFLGFAAGSHSHDIEVVQILLDEGVDSNQVCFFQERQLELLPAEIALQSNKSPEYVLSLLKTLEDDKQEKVLLKIASKQPYEYIEACLNSLTIEPELREKMLILSCLSESSHQSIYCLDRKVRLYLNFGGIDPYRKVVYLNDNDEEVSTNFFDTVRNLPREAQQVIYPIVSDMFLEGGFTPKKNKVAVVAKLQIPDRFLYGHVTVRQSLLDARSKLLTSHVHILKEVYFKVIVILSIRKKYKHGRADKVLSRSKSMSVSCGISRRIAEYLVGDSTKELKYLNDDDLHLLAYKSATDRFDASYKLARSSSLQRGKGFSCKSTLSLLNSRSLFRMF